MTRNELKQLFQKYDVNQKVVDSFLQHDWLDGYAYNDLEKEIKEWGASSDRPLSDYIEAHNFFVYLTQD